MKGESKVLDQFLEHTIQKKQRIFSILNTHYEATMKDLAKELDISINSLSSLIDELSLELEGLATLSKDGRMVRLEMTPGGSYLDLLHAIFQSSNVLSCLCFLLTNETHDSFEHFMEDHYLTRPSAYRIRQTCVHYLHLIGLDVSRNYVVGEEYRIRYLMALLYYKYGIECFTMDETSVHILQQFIIATNRYMNVQFLERTYDEYGYYECLMTLAWKRKKYPVVFKDETSLTHLKSLFVYDLYLEYIHTYLEPALGLTFDKAELDYMYLVYVSVNNCIFADRFDEEAIQAVRRCVFSETHMREMVQSFEHHFGISMVQSPAFLSVMIFFFKKSLLGLQCIIPDKHFYLDSKTDPCKELVKEEVETLIQPWLGGYPLGEDHLRYLSLQISTILQQFMPPVPVIVVTDLTSEMEVFKLYLHRQFAKERIHIRPVFFNAEDVSWLPQWTHCVIIVKKIFYPTIVALGCSSHQHVVPIHIEINERDKKTIAEAIRAVEQDIFKEFILK